MNILYKIFDYILYQFTIMYFVTVTKYYYYCKTCQSMNGKNKYLATEDDFFLICIINEGSLACMKI